MHPNNLWAIARALKVPGVRANPTFDPASISPRIREAARRMILNGAIIGTWASKSRHVARVLSAHAGLPIVQSNGQVLKLSAQLTAGQAAKLRELVNADAAAELLIPKYPSWMRHMPAHEKAARRAESVKHLVTTNTASIDNALRDLGWQDTYLHFHDKRFGAMALKCLDGAEAELIEKRKATAALLDLKHPFTINNLNFNDF